jgi:hypothetical protein
MLLWKDIISYAYGEMNELRWDLCDFDPVDLSEDAFNIIKDV